MGREDRTRHGGAPALRGANGVEHGRQPRADGGRLTRVGFTGIRDLAAGPVPEVEMAVAEIAGEAPEEMIFGGARGSDTVALGAACACAQETTRLVVIVPGRLGQQPREARGIAADCADEIVELRRDPRLRSSYHHRNEAIVTRSDRVVAFWDGEPGGTAHTIGIAREAGKPVLVVPITRRRDVEPRRNPAVETFAGMTGGIYLRTRVEDTTVVGLDWYRSATVAHPLSEFARDVKSGAYDSERLRLFAEMCAAAVGADPDLAATDAIVPMPRRLPGLACDLGPLAVELARLTGKTDGTGWIQRQADPRGGRLFLRRLRFPCEEHARTLRYAGVFGLRVLLLDNVVTTSGTACGAVRACRRDGVEPSMLALTFSRALEAVT